MNYFSAMLLNNVKPLFEPDIRPTFKSNKGAKARAQAFENMYRKVFEQNNWVLSTNQFGREANVSEARRVLKKLESRKLVECIGTEPSGGTVPRKVYRWIDSADVTGGDTPTV